MVVAFAEWPDNMQEARAHFSCLQSRTPYILVCYSNSEIWAWTNINICLKSLVSAVSKTYFTSRFCSIFSVATRFTYFYAAPNSNVHRVHQSFDNLDVFFIDKKSLWQTLTNICQHLPNFVKFANIWKKVQTPKTPNITFVMMTTFVNILIFVSIWFYLCCDKIVFYRPVFYTASTAGRLPEWRLPECLLCIHAFMMVQYSHITYVHLSNEIYGEYQPKSKLIGFYFLSIPQRWSACWV